MDDLQRKYTVFKLTNKTTNIIRIIFNIRQSIAELNGIADIMIIVMNGNVR